MSKINLSTTTLSQTDIESFIVSGTLSTPFGIINNTHVTVNYEIKTTESYKYKLLNDVLVLADTTEDEETKDIYIAREVVKVIQTTRKDSNLNSWDKINVYYASNSQTLSDLIVKMKKYICDIINSPLNELTPETILSDVVIENSNLIIGAEKNVTIKIIICKG